MAHQRELKGESLQVEGLTILVNDQETEVSRDRMEQTCNLSSHDLDVDRKPSSSDWLNLKGRKHQNESVKLLGIKKNAQQTLFLLHPSNALGF